MRIISGKYKGNLVSFKADHIRPTTDRVKESLFNILMGLFDSAKVCDLFSGTGSLGIEALSRGAKEATFVEENRKSIAILNQNLEKLNVTEPTQIVAKDVVSFLKNYQGEAFDIIFIDPPFTKSMAHDVMESLSQSKVFHENSIITIESGRREKILEDYGPLIRYNKREFGDKILSFFKKR